MFRLRGNIVAEGSKLSLKLSEVINLTPLGEFMCSTFSCPTFITQLDELLKPFPLYATTASQFLLNNSQ